MTVVTGQGSDGNIQLAAVFSSNAYVISAQTVSSFTATNLDDFSSAVFTGTGFAYNGNTLTAGTITGVTYSRATSSGPNTQIWMGLSVSAATAIALAQSDTSAFNQLLFGDDDVITFTTLPGADPILNGFDGNDVFNVSDWSRNGHYIVDGGDGNDTLNITGGIVGTPNGFLDPTNLDVINVETINLGAGYNYVFVLNADFAESGHSATINGSALGPSNNLVIELLGWTGPMYGDLVLIGGAGNDIFEPSLGSFIFNGGAGSDTVELFHHALDDLNFTIGTPPGTPGYRIDLGLTTPQSLVTGGQLQGSATFIDIENLAGSPFDDTLSGNASDNIFAPGAGADVLDGRGGNDTVWYSFPRAIATITYSGHTITIKAGAETTTTLTDIEFAHFSDQTIRIAGPVVTTANVAAQHDHTLALSSLFSATDLTGDPITAYQLWDDNDDPTSGHFTIDGVEQAAKTIIDVSPTQLAQTSFVAGTVSDSLQIRAYDGFSWSAPDDGPWSPFTIDVASTISIGNASVTEGGVLQFGVTLSAAASQNITLGYDTFAGTASMADNDYLGGTGTLTILAGQTTGTISIQTVQDSKFEPDETMSVHLLTASFGNITQGVGTGTIVNDDPAPPNITIGNASVTEGGVLQFDVTLSAAASQNITLGYDTFAGTASMADNDYLGGTGTLTILAGQTTGTISIQTVQDSKFEPDETMSVHLLTASFGNITQGIGTGTIVNDDVAPPNITIGNASVTEGGVLQFGVTLSAAASQNITLGYDTFAGTASMADNDYLGGTGTLTILAGQTTGTIDIQTVQDSKLEGSETMSVHLLTASFGNITQGIGTGTIVNDDVAPPNITIGNASVTEGGVLQFGVTLSAAASQNITLGYDTFAGTASMADNDYLGGTGTLTILAGQTTGTISIQTVQDSKFEPDETMSVHLLTASFGAITQGIGTGTIVNDDPVPPNISIGNASVTEGGVLQFGVTLSAAASQNITLGYDTFAGTASMADNDYLGGTGTLAILAGQTTGTISIQTVQDAKVEPDETMSVHLLSASLGNITQGVGIGTIDEGQAFEMARQDLQARDFSFAASPASSAAPLFGTRFNTLAPTLAGIS